MHARAAAGPLCVSKCVKAFARLIHTWAFRIWPPIDQKVLFGPDHPSSSNLESIGARNIANLSGRRDVRRGAENDEHGGARHDHHTDYIHQHSRHRTGSGAGGARPCGK